MKQEQTITKIRLIEGKFSPLDAANVIFSMLTDKIKFHQLQELSFKTQTPERLSHAQKRIETLRDDKNKIRDLIIYARDLGYDLKIKGNIEIELCKK